MPPKSRQDRITVCELPDELLVYDHDRQKGHCLNAAAALVWRHCDGETSLEELARLVADRLTVAEPAAVVGLALEQLGRRHLLEEPPPPLPPDQRLGRREALKRLVRMAAALPLILTVATKASAQFGSGGGGGGGSTPAPTPPAAPVVQVNVAVAGGSGSGSKTTTPAPTPCRTKGQSCVAAMSGQQGTCCQGLTCTGVSQNAGVCA